VRDKLPYVEPRDLSGEKALLLHGMQAAVLWRSADLQVLRQAIPSAEEPHSGHHEKQLFRKLLLASVLPPLAM
jgi:hypothetical protein